MSRCSLLILRALALAALLGPVPALRGEEGMWTFDHLPAAAMRARYGFAPDAAWLDRVRLSVLRFPGGTGAFISRDGLVLTNHHVAHSWIEQVSDAGHDYVQGGFLARSRDQELRVPGLELRTLMLTEDVTAALAKAEAAGRERRTVLAGLVRAAQRRTGLACEPVEFYHGCATWIYGYQVHRDVRLVMAPEYAIAAFGKDWDNFTFPRHDLDFALFRVYRDGLPYHPPDYLRWARAGLKAGDLTLVAGHPGSTSRTSTLAELETIRDVLDPLRRHGLERDRQALRGFAARGPEQAREASAQLFALENSLKACRNEARGLEDGPALARVAAAEQELRAQVARDPALKASAGPSWERIAQAERDRAAVARECAMLDGRGSRALAFALSLVRRQPEAAKPESEAGALDLELEQTLLTEGLAEAEAELGANHPIVAALLAGQTPADRARALLAGTRLLDPGVRQALSQERPAAVLASADPLLVLARRLDQLSRPYLDRQRQAEAVIAAQDTLIARARFALRGQTDYPEATFSLRLSYGAVASYPANGTLVQPFTTFGGLFDRADGWGPEAEEHAWALPTRWRERRPALDPSTPYDFISSNDIIGGNSGSPVLDRNGELAGLVFDGNLAALAGRFYYDGARSRAVSVDARAILAALDRVYDASALTAEILARQCTMVSGPPVSGRCGMAANQLFTARIPALLRQLAPAVAVLAMTAPLAAQSRPELLKPGVQAPDFTAAIPGGGSVKLSSLRGQIVVLDFWATWCPPCKASMPHLQAVSQATAGQKVKVLAVCVWDQRANFDTWVKTRTDLTFQMAYDPAGRSPNGIAGSQYQVSGIPTTYIIDAQGRIADALDGYSNGDKRVEDALRKLGVRL